LPIALAQVFQNLMGTAKSQIHGMNVVRDVSPSEPPFPQPEKPKSDLDEWKMQLKEMIDGNISVPQAAQPRPQTQPQSKPLIQTKNPLLAEALNHTRPFNSQERFAMRAGGGGGMAMMSPAVAMAGAQFGGGGLPETGAGPLMDDSELSFMKNVPGMPGADAPVVANLPTSGQAARLAEGQEGGAAPMESLGDVSALDIRNHPDMPDSLKGILNRDYRSLVKAMDKKK
jgi:hypothetical protein